MSSVKKSITRRLIYSFSILIFTFLVFGIYSLFDLHNISNLTRTIYHHPLVVSNAAHQANTSVTKMHRHMKDVVLFSNDFRIEEAIQKVDQEEQLVYEYLDVVRDRILGVEGQIHERETRVLLDQWRPIRSSVIQLVREGKRDEAAEITIGRGAEHVDCLEEKMLALTTYARTKATFFMQESEQAYSRVLLSSILYLIFATLLATAIAIFTLKRTAENESEIREARFLLESAIYNAPIGMIIVGMNGFFIRVNDAFCEITGYSTDELLEKNFQEITYPDDYDIGNHTIKQLTDGKVDKASIEKRYIKKDGSIIHVLLTTTLLKSANGVPLFFFTQTQDITEQKMTAQRIEHLNRVLRSIRDVNQLIVREHNPELLIREGCQLLVDNRGYSSVLIILTNIDHEMVCWAGAGIASRSKELESMLTKQEMPPCYKLFHSTSGVVVIDDRDCNCADCPLLTRCVDTPSMCIRLEHENNEFGFMVVALHQYSRVDDEEKNLFVEMAGDLAYALHYIQTSDERKKSDRKSKALERQLIQAQKMESVGRLAGGVAHDYNNMLTIIMGYAELAIEKLNPEQSLYSDLEEIYKAARRSSDITRQLLAFARKQITSPKVLDLNGNIESMLKMLRRLMGEDIDLAWIPFSEVWPVRMDPVQIDQILANLCVNARDAIEGVGQVTIETMNTSFDQEYCIDHVGFLPGEYVLLAVSDNGRGISQENLDKIFEPFFTTKNLHKGTGLGLSTVYGILKQNHGFINVYSELGKGTTLKCYFPRYQGQIVNSTPLPITEIPFAQGETVLLVEDDVPILNLGRRMLQSLNYLVLQASTTAEALDYAENHDGEIELLITDVIMPGMNGRELNECVQEFRPNIKTLFMSGYTANVIAHRGVLDDGVSFIQKPLSKKELAIKVRDVLRDEKRADFCE